MRRYDGSQNNQNKVLDNRCHVTSVLMAFVLKITLKQLPLFLDATSAKRGSCLLKGNFEENPMKNLPTQ